VFPQFGQPNKDMPQHGFLRNNYWKSGEVFDNEEEAGCEFSLSLKDVVHARGDGIWKDENVVNCSVTLSVTVTANCMTTELLINNTGEKTFDYQTLFHTYFKIYDRKLWIKSSVMSRALLAIRCMIKLKKKTEYRVKIQFLWIVN